MVDLGNRVSNIISTGDGESDLYLTFTFVWNAPDMQDGTAEAAGKDAQYSQMAGEAVNSTIKQLRAEVQGNL